MPQFPGAIPTCFRLTWTLGGARLKGACPVLSGAPAQGPFCGLQPAIAEDPPHRWSPWRSLLSQWPTDILGEGHYSHRPHKFPGAFPTAERLTAPGPGAPARREATHTQSRCCPGDGNRWGSRDLEEAGRERRLALTLHSL